MYGGDDIEESQVTDTRLFPRLSCLSFRHNSLSSFCPENFLSLSFHFFYILFVSFTLSFSFSYSLFLQSDMSFSFYSSLSFIFIYLYLYLYLCTCLLLYFNLNLFLLLAFPQMPHDFSFHALPAWINIRRILSLPKRS